MEKTIKLVMLENKNIDISVNGESCIVIDRENRTIKADDIYRLLNYSKGDSYIINRENEHGLDEPVLSFFVQLFEEIAERIKRMENEPKVYTEETTEDSVQSEVDETDELPF